MIKNYLHEIMLVALACIVIVSAHGVWIDYPISAVVRGLNWQLDNVVLWHNLLALPYLLLLTLALIFILFGWKKTGSLLLATSLLALLSVPISILLFDSSWLKSYIEDVTQYEQLQFIVRFTGGIPNAEFGSYLKGIDDFHYLTDRFLITLNMLGWGWIVCFISSGFLVWLLYQKNRLHSLAMIFWPLLIGVVITAIIGSKILRADFQYRAADQSLGLGDYNGALDHYSQALQQDPSLGESRTYMNNVSKAYYQLGGSTDARGQLYLANNSSNLTLDSINALLVASKMSNDGSLLSTALSNMARRAEAEHLIKKSLRAYKFSDLGTASITIQRVLQTHPEWRHARYFKAHVLGQLHEYNTADQELSDLLLSVHKNTVKAILYNALGDIQSASGNIDRARDYYSQSYKLDKTNNLWAIKGLGGT